MLGSNLYKIANPQEFHYFNGRAVEKAWKMIEILLMVGFVISTPFVFISTQYKKIKKEDLQKHFRIPIIIHTLSFLWLFIGYIFLHYNCSFFAKRCKNDGFEIISFIFFFLAPALLTFTLGSILFISMKIKMKILQGQQRS